ncbi:MAG: twin-arginine translocase subunit TatC [Gemmatimonadota bacterium]|nr:twin-arginine translocase subunit TatC [Gemmatimonadota bacterium]MDH3423375.1 twin-arginine translocase subunit TatC [Gemmatimonadota bacterium]
MSRHRNPKGEMPFLDHLEELRWRILWSILAIVIGTGIGFALVVYFDVLELLVLPVREAWDDPNLRLIYLSPADPFFVMLRLAIYCGLILSFPIIVYQIWVFLSPALEKREKRAVIPALYLGLLLFIAGVALAYFAALPVTLEFFQNFLNTSLEGQLEINKTLGFIVKMLLAFGAVFELPIVIMILSALGLVTPAFLRAKRRHAIVLITILASFITPGDAITLTVMMMFPLLLLYEFGIFLSVGIYRGKRKRAEEYEASLDGPPGALESQ